MLEEKLRVTKEARRLMAAAIAPLNAAEAVLASFNLSYRNELRNIQANIRSSILTLSGQLELLKLLQISVEEEINTSSQPASKERISNPFRSSTDY